MQIKPIILFLSLFLVTCLSGCEKDETKDNQNVSDDFKIYYVSDDNQKIYSYDYGIVNEDDSDLVNDILIKLRAGGYPQANDPVIPSNIDSIGFKESGEILILNFDQHYLEMSGSEEVLRRAAIVKTFCQLDKVEYVKFNVKDQPLEIDGLTIGNMSEDSFLNNVGEGSDFHQQVDVTIYYTNSFGNKLKKLPTKVEYDGTKPLEQLVVEKLIQGSNRIGYYPTLYPDVVVNKVTINNKKCFIDFNEKFLQGYNGVSEEVIIYSIVNTVTELQTANQVMITVDGESIDYYQDSVRLDRFINRNFEINEEKE